MVENWSSKCTISVIRSRNAAAATGGSELRHATAGNWETGRCGISNTTSRLLKNEMVKARVEMRGPVSTELQSSVAPLLGNFASVEVAFSILRTDSSRRRRLQLGNTNEIVGGSGKDEEPLDQASTAMTRLAQRADCLHPAEWLLDTLALNLADAIARVTGRAAVHGRASVGVILRDVGRATALAAAGDKVRRVIILVSTDRAARTDVVLDHVEGSAALGGAVGLGQTGIDDQPITVLGIAWFAQRGGYPAAKRQHLAACRHSPRRLDQC